MLKNWLMNSAAVFSPPDEGKPAPGKPTVLNEDVGNENDGGTEGADGAEGAEGAAGDDDAAGDGAEGDGDPPAEGAAAPPVAAAKPDWKDKELNRKHRQLQDERREKARIQQELDDAKALLARAPKKDGDPDPVAQPARTFTEADVDRAASARVAQDRYNEQCNETFNKGKATYGDDWDKSLKQLELLGGLGDDAQGLETMQGILAADDPAKVLHTLGSDPDEYHRVMSLPPARRLAEIIKIGIPDKKTIKKPSALDPPVNGIQRRAQADNAEAKLYDDKTPDADWYAIRVAQKKRRFEAKQAGRVA